MVAGVGMGNVTMNFMGISIVTGLSNALDTFISQAYGAKNFELCGIYLNRARFVMVIAFIPIIFVSMQIENVLVYLGQSSEVARYA